MERALRHGGACSAAAGCCCEMCPTCHAHGWCCMQAALERGLVLDDFTIQQLIDEKDSFVAGQSGEQNEKVQQWTAWQERNGKPGLLAGVAWDQRHGVAWHEQRQHALGWWYVAAGGHGTAWVAIVWHGAAQRDMARQRHGHGMGTEWHGHGTNMSLAGQRCMPNLPLPPLLLPQWRR